MAERKGVLLITQFPWASSGIRRPTVLCCYFSKDGGVLHGINQLRTASSETVWGNPYSMVSPPLSEFQLSAGCFASSSSLTNFPLFQLWVSEQEAEWQSKGFMCNRLFNHISTDYPSSRTWRNSVLTPATYTRKIDPDDQWLYVPKDSSLQVLTRNRPTAAWQPLDSVELGMKADSVASCLNRQGIWVFVTHEYSNTLKIFLRRHGEYRFTGRIVVMENEYLLTEIISEEIGNGDVPGKCVGAASSWLGNPRVIVAERPKIYEYWWDGQNLKEPTTIVNVGSKLHSITVSVAYQREMDTPDGHLPETLTVAYAAQRDGEILSSVWTNVTNTWREGPPMVSPRG